MDVIRAGVSAFLLREQPFERFRFSRWQSRFVITLLGVLQGLAMHMHVHALKASDLALPTLWGKVVFGVKDWTLITARICGKLVNCS